MRLSKGQAVAWHSSDMADLRCLWANNIFA
jgi:hypothetical protein